MINKRVFIIAIAASAILAGCTKPALTPAQNDAGQLTQLSISQPYIIPPFPGRDTALAGFKITNIGDTADRLLFISSPVSERIETHTHIEDGGVMKMRRVEGGLEIKPGQSLTLKRGADHIMVFETTIAADTDTVPLTLQFEVAGDITVQAKVRHEGDMPDLD
ncbi:copper chaperone PCu(A)C [Robiginitomaculum antarcticum]|uniref:copper chaperone PCu(A)C n=1 Tax=Robiginitomaculum antarcticum TaxID=437507 RepID=UPI00037031C7|nr:copper chaperone PCu(A)C [Robiginitomaculum antarcticum]